MLEMLLGAFFVGALVLARSQGTLPTERVRILLTEWDPFQQAVTFHALQ